MLISFEETYRLLTNERDADPDSSPDAGNDTTGAAGNSIRAQGQGRKGTNLLWPLVSETLPLVLPVMVASFRKSR